VSAPSVAVLDYGSGNIHSAVKALELAGADVFLTSNAREAQEADGLLLPGVGAFSAVMDALTHVRGDAIVDKRLAGGRPVLGICVGMQVLFSRGVERGIETEGLGEWPGVVEELRSPIVPHMGWNTVDAAAGTALFDGIENERFYFVHSTLHPEPPFPAPKVTWADHGGPFVAAVENGPLTATQFHPEKSGPAGIRLLAYWLRMLR
jgi:glutamine amidotransferase